MAMYDNEPTMMGQGRPVGTLVIRQGPQAGMSFPITGGQVIIGREEGLDISLQDPESSRRHARISWQAGQFVIEDMGSTNGTFVNGVQITSAQILNPGDSIGIGQTALVFQVTGGQQQQAGQPQYQAPPPAYAAPAPAEPPPAASGGTNITQYALYGCGCLMLLAICMLLAIAGWAVFNQDVIDSFLSTGLLQQIELLLA